MRVWTLAVILVLLAAGSALLSAIETAFFSLHPAQLRRLRDQNPGLADRLSRLLENPRRLLSIVLLGEAMVNVPLIVLSYFLLGRVSALPVPFVVAAAIIFTFIAIGCDLVPKVIALDQPYRIALTGTRVVALLTPLLGPAAHLFQRASEVLADAVTPNWFQAHVPLSEEELETLVELSAEEGTLEPAESEMIQEVLKLGNKTVKDCMTPRVDLFSIPDDLTNEEAISRLRAARHRRVPVYGETPDEIVGILEVSRFLLHPAEHYVEQVIPPSFVPETMKALDLLRSFMNHPQGLAVIVDEFGGTEGIITLNDFIEEIISDAVPSGEQELYIEPMGGGRAIAAGRTRLDDLVEFGFNLEQEGVDTIGGLVFNYLGSVPRVGASVKIGDVLVEVRRSSRRGVEEVLLVKESAPTGGPEVEEES